MKTSNSRPFKKGDIVLYSPLLGCRAEMKTEHVARDDQFRDSNRHEIIFLEGKSGWVSCENLELVKSVESIEEDEKAERERRQNVAAAKLSGEFSEDMF